MNPTILHPVPGYPRYYVDPEAHTLYAIQRDRTIRQCKTFGTTESCTLTDDEGNRRSVNMPRLEYCISMNISPSDIPNQLAVVRDDKGQAILITKTELTARAQQQRWLNHYTDSMEEIRHNLDLILLYQSGHRAALVTEIEQKRQRVVQQLKKQQIYTLDKIETESMLAMDKLLASIEAGKPVCHFFSFLRKTTLGNLTRNKYRINGLKKIS